MEEYSAITDAINEANSLAEKTAASLTTRSSSSGGRVAGGGSGSAGSKRGKASAGTANRGARGDHRSGDDGSKTEAREGGALSAEGGGGGGGGGVQAASVGLKSRASGDGSGGRGGVKGAGAAGAGTGSVGSKDVAASYTVARHVADFGNVVVGFTKTRAFRVANTGKLGPLSWSFNKNTLAGTGYSIEPEKVVRLPEGASAAFSASFQARLAFLVFYVSIYRRFREQQNQ